MDSFFQFTFQIKKIENSLDFVLFKFKYKSYCVYIKDFDRITFHKTKNKNKKQFSKAVYGVLVVKML